MRPSSFLFAFALVLACSPAKDTSTVAPNDVAPGEQEGTNDPAIVANCEKLTELTLARLPEGRADPVVMIETCVAKSTERKEADPEAFATESTCIEAASALEDVVSCATAAQVDEQTPYEDLALDEKLRRVCERMSELAQKEPDLPPEVKAELADIDECVVEARREYELDPERFEKLAACTMDAADLRALMECALALPDLTP